MASSNYACPTCKKEYTSKKKMRACLFGHMADDEEVEKTTEPTEGELLTEEELDPEEEIEDEVNEQEEDIVEDDEPEEEIEDEPEGEYFVKEPVVVQAYQTDKKRKIETLEGTMTANPGDYVITGVAGEQYPCKPEIFEKTYKRCDGEVSPTIIPRHLCPQELTYLATEQPVSVRVQGTLTPEYEIDVKEVEFVRR